MRVQGVPWPVPSNTVFDVEDLPSILSMVPFNTCFVWFDLVCIPQDGSELQTTEISRQAAIFKSAKWATIWFNRLHDFSGLRAALAWASYLYLSDCKLDGVDEQWSVSRPELAEKAGQTTGLASFIDGEDGPNPDRPHFRSIGHSPVKYMVPDGWFSSLWTLQEACLRPDLYLCSKSWEVFAAGGSSPFAVQLDHTLALIKTVHTIRNEDLPTAVYELVSIVGKTLFIKLLWMTPIDLLTLGHKRYCQDANRATAIMSALGTTDWYQEYHRRTQHIKEDDLVRTFIEQKYPLEILSEVKDKFGGLFFYSLSQSPFSLDHYRFESRCGRLSWVKMAATTMPFSRDTQRNFGVVFPPALNGMFSDPAVENWVINNDGSVDINLACIVAACPRQNAMSTRAKVQAVVPRCKCKNGDYARAFRSKEIDLTDWLHSFRPTSEKLAVCLIGYQTQTGGMVLGMLLERVYTGRERKEFIKFGQFWIVYGKGEASQILSREVIDIKVL